MSSICSTLSPSRGACCSAWRHVVFAHTGWAHTSFTVPRPLSERCPRRRRPPVMHACTTATPKNTTTGIASLRIAVATVVIGDTIHAIHTCMHACLDVRLSSARCCRPMPSPVGAACSVYATTTPKLRKSSEDGAPGVGGLYMSDCAPSPFNPAVT